MEVLAGAVRQQQQTHRLEGKKEEKELSNEMIIYMNLAQNKSSTYKNNFYF